MTTQKSGISITNTNDLQAVYSVINNVSSEKTSPAMRSTPIESVYQARFRTTYIGLNSFSLHDQLKIEGYQGFFTPNPQSY